MRECDRLMNSLNTLHRKILDDADNSSHELTIPQLNAYIKFRSESQLMITGLFLSLDESLYTLEILSTSENNFPTDMDMIKKTYEEPFEKLKKNLVKF
jgi:hypothetical protein